MAGFEEQMRIGAVGDRLAIELDAHAARRRLKGDPVVGIGFEPGFADLRCG
jgi:hypothetical protein